jgi:hypothetical protein
MPDPATGIESQIRNIERTYGKPISHWFTVITDSGLTKHQAIVAMLKERHGFAQGAAHRVSILHRNEPAAPTVDPAAGATDDVRAIYESLITFTRRLSDDVEMVPKKGYLSLRRRKQFAMLKPARHRVDVGLILPDMRTKGRLEDAATFNRLFTHRIRVDDSNLDRELKGWIRAAHAGAQ